jgi:hypothetical protein
MREAALKTIGFIGVAKVCLCPHSSLTEGRDLKIMSREKVINNLAGLTAAFDAETKELLPKEPRRYACFRDQFPPGWLLIAPPPHL